MTRTRTLSSAKGIWMRPPQFFSPVRGGDSHGRHSTAPSLTPVPVPCTFTARWCHGRSPLRELSRPRCGLQPVHQLHRGSEGPPRGVLHIPSSSAGCCHPSPPPDKYSITLHVGKEAPQEVQCRRRAETGSAAAHDAAGKQHPHEQTCLGFSFTEPEWSSRAETDS